MNSAEQPIIQVKDLTFNYPRFEPVLKQISFKINQGEKTVLLGPNGAGKSTLMYLLLRILQPTGGQIYFEKKQLQNLPEELLRRKMGYLFQNPDDQVFGTTVEEDILFGPAQVGMENQISRSRLNGIIELLELGDLLRRNPRSLSYGEKRRVALAGLLIMEPDIILFDEPLAFLDPPGKEKLSQVMDELTARGTTLLLATHDLDFAAGWGESFLLLAEGKLISSRDKSILVKQNIAFPNSLPLSAKIFKGFIQEDALPVNLQESRQLLEILLTDKILNRLER